MKRYFIYKLLKEVVILPFKLVSTMILTLSMCVAESWCNIIED